MLERDEHRIETAFGPVRIKVAKHPDGRRRYKIEHDDLAPLLAEASDPWSREHAIRREIDAWFNARLRTGDLESD